MKDISISEIIEKTEANIKELNLLLVERRQELIIAEESKNQWEINKSNSHVVAIENSIRTAEVSLSLLKQGYYLAYTYPEYESDMEG